MKSKFPGFYHPSEEQFDNMLQNALIVFDANILLDLYRVSSDTSKNLMDIIRKLDSRLWIPYQVAYEYHKELFTVISNQIKKYEESAATIKEIRKKMAEKRNHPFLPDDLSTKATCLFNELEEFFQKQQNNLQNVVLEKSVKEELGELLEGKVGECFNTKELEDIYQEGKRRYDSKIPPGYMDEKTKQGSDVYGDLVIWKEIQRKAVEEKCDVIIVTDDVKEDWFMQFKGKNCGPHPALIKEFKDKTNHNVYIYTLDRFLALSEKLQFEVKTETLQEIEQREPEEIHLSDFFGALLNKEKGETMQSSASESIGYSSKDYSSVLDALIRNSLENRIGRATVSGGEELSETSNSEISTSERISEEPKSSTLTGNPES